MNKIGWPKISGFHLGVPLGCSSWVLLAAAVPSAWQAGAGTGRQADEQMGGRAGGRTGRRAGGQTSGQGKWMGGRTGGRTGERVDGQVGGRACSSDVMLCYSCSPESERRGGGQGTSGGTTAISDLRNILRMTHTG